MFILGLYIGYSNVKMAYGFGKEPTTKILPACADPIENISKNINGEHIDGNIVLN